MKDMDKDINIDDCQLMFGDCLERMKEIPDGSIDMILCDLPYGVLNKNNPDAKWDCILPFDKLWNEYDRVIKDNGAIVLFGQGMFTAKMMISNIGLWRYNLIWDKNAKTGFLNASRMPLRQHEDIMVFYKRLPIYNPQMIKSNPYERNHGKGKNNKSVNQCYGTFISTPTIMSDYKYPTSIIKIPKDHLFGKFYHPTPKSVNLLEYLIKTYTNENNLVLDNTMGSGSTGVACINTNRKFIGIEMDEKYFEIACSRIKDSLNQPRLF